MFAISPIDLDSLVPLKPLFDRSAGYEVALENEIAGGWQARNPAGQVLGFIRTFDFEPTYSHIEFYVDPDCKFRKSVGLELFKKFQNEILTTSSHRWRLDLPFFDEEINQVVQDLQFFDEFKVFRYFETLKFDSHLRNRCLYEKKGDPSEVATALSFLSPVSEFEVYSWMADDQIRVLCLEGEILCAAQVFFSDDSAEIVRLSTKPQSLSKGFGSEMIQHLKNEMIQRKIPCLNLKVEDNNQAAIQFYLKHGFKEIVSRKQFWYSKTT